MSIFGKSEEDIMKGFKKLLKNDLLTVDDVNEARGLIQEVIDKSQEFIEKMSEELFKDNKKGLLEKARKLRNILFLTTALIRKVYGRNEKYIKYMEELAKKADNENKRLEAEGMATQVMPIVQKGLQMDSDKILNALPSLIKIINLAESAA